MFSAKNWIGMNGDAASCVQKLFKFLMLVLILGCRPSTCHQFDDYDDLYFEFKNDENSQFYEQHSYIFRKLLQNNQQSPEQQDYTQQFNNYQEAIEEINAQNDIVRTIYNQLKTTRTTVLQQLQDLQNQQEKLNAIIKDTQFLEFLADSNEIQLSHTDFLEAHKQYSQAAYRYAQITQDQLEQQKDFERELSVLQNNEVNLSSIRDQLQKVSEKNFTGIDFNIADDHLSQQYYYLADKNKIEQLFIQEKPEFYKTVKVSGQIRISGLNLTNLRSGFTYLNLVLKNENSNVLIENSKFSGVGLRIEGYNNTNKIIIKNVTIENAPVDGIQIWQSNQCYIEKCKISSATDDGIYIFGVTRSTLESVSIEKSLWGLNFQSYLGYVKNSVFKNNRVYGIVVGSGSSVVGSNVTFGGNPNESSGNYTTQV